MSLAGKLCLALSGFSLIVLVVTTWILGGWLPFLYIFLILFVLGVGLAVIMDWQLYIGFLSMKTAKNGISMGFSILLTVVLCFSLAYLSTRFEISFDITEEKINSLAPQTLQILDTLDEDLYIRVFYKGKEGQRQRNAIRRNLFLFKQTSSRIKDRYYNAYTENSMAQKYLNDLSDKNNNIFVFVEYKGQKTQALSPFNEEKITSAMIQVTRRGERSVYFLSGHGERDKQELSQLQSALTDSSFRVKGLNFIKDGFQVPTDSAALLIVGPSRLFLPKEMEAVTQYLEQGGRVLLALDPDRQTSDGESTQKTGAKNFQSLLSTFGIKYTGHYLASRLPAIMGLGPLGILGMHFDQQHPITRSFESGAFVIFNRASPVKTTPMQNVQFTELVKTNVHILSAASLEREQLQKGKRSSYVVGVVAKRKNDLDADPKNKSTNNTKKDKPKKKATLLAVFGDSDFMTNPFFHASTGWNKDIIMNTIAWLVDEADLISIRARKLKSTQLILKQSDKMGIILFSIILPCILFIVGGVLWFRRRGA